MVSPLKSQISRLKIAIAGAALILAGAAVPAAFAQGTRVAPLYQQQQNQQQNGQPGMQGQPGQFPQAQPPNAQLPAPAGPEGGDLVLGPGDVLQLQVADEPDLNGKYLVSDSGDVAIPMVPKPVHAAGLTTTQLSQSIAQALKAAEILQQPVVSVFVDQYNSHTVTVVGAVVRPGLYPVETHTTVLQAISEAGGLLPDAGNMVTVAKAGTQAAATLKATAAKPGKAGQPGMDANGKPTVQAASFKPPMSNRDVVRLDFGKLVSGKDPSVNIEVHAGDVVSVGTAPVVYIVGAVVRPGAFAIQSNDSKVTVLQAIALVQGMTPVAAPKHAIIVRNSASLKERREIPINLDKLKTGKQPDQYLQANDILFIPESGMKKSLRALGSFASHAAEQVAGYGALGAF